MTTRTDREFWNSLEPFWQDAGPGWVSYTFPNGRRLLLQGERAGQTAVTYDGATGETTVSMDRDDLPQFVADVMAMPR